MLTKIAHSIYGHRLTGRKETKATNNMDTGRISLYDPTTQTKQLPTKFPAAHWTTASQTLFSHIPHQSFRTAFSMMVTTTVN